MADGKILGPHLLGAIALPLLSRSCGTGGTEEEDSGADSRTGGSGPAKDLSASHGQLQIAAEERWTSLVQERGSSRMPKVERHEAVAEPMA